VTRSSTYDPLGQLIGESGSGTGAASASRGLAYDGLWPGRKPDQCPAPSAYEEFYYDDRDLLTGSRGWAAPPRSPWPRAAPVRRLSFLPASVRSNPRRPSRL